MEREAVQITCDLIQLTKEHVEDDIESLIASELAMTALSSILCPESAPSATTTSLPCLSFDPDDELGLSKFSSFTPATHNTTNLTPSELKRRLQKKELFVVERRKRARTEAAVVGAITPLQLPQATVPTTPRAGLAGVQIKVDKMGQLVGGKRAPKVESPHPPASSVPFTDDEEQHRRASVEAYLIEQHPKLKGYTFAHRTGRAGQAVTFVDFSRRAFATRIECPQSLSGLADELNTELEETTASIAAFKTDQSRGKHDIRQIGVHRETGAIEPVYSAQFTRSPTKWLTVMQGKAFGRVRGHVSRCLETHYPAIFDYHRTLSSTLLSRGLYFLFGAFASFCLNLGGRVACLPHRDKHNLGPGLCGVVPFGKFKSWRSGWLVLQEARLCIEVGPLDVALFPSAIFTHWNTAIHQDDERQSLATWCGASLFLWSELGGKSLSHFGPEKRAEVYESNKRSWLDAWERFPVL